MSEKISFIAQPTQPAKSVQVVHTVPATLTAQVVPLVAPASAPVISPVPAPALTTELAPANNPSILDLPIWSSRDTQNVKPIPTPLTLLTPLAPLPLPQGVMADTKSPKSLASPLGDTKPLVKKIEDDEEPISVTFSSRQTSSVKPQITQPKAEVIPPTAKSPAWIPVTSNDGQLVIRNQGNFVQIKVGGVLPNGETLKSINEASGKFETNTGTYSIKENE
jgi:hypothetical protein